MEIIEVTPIMQNNIPSTFFSYLGSSKHFFVFNCSFVIFLGHRKSRKICAILFGSFILCIFSAGVACAIVPDTPSGRNRYTAIVDDSADYKEIVEKYNIIESHGKIWVLEDK